MMKAIALLFLTLCNTIPVMQADKAWQKLHAELMIVNPPFAQCHASTLVQLSSGDIMTAWFAGSGEGNKDVCIWSAISIKGIWSAPRVIATGIINDSLRFPCWNPVLFVTKNKTLLLFYKVGPSPQSWWGMMMRSADNGKTWSMPGKLPDGILGPIKNKPVQLKDGTILSASSTETPRKWSVHLEKSTDNGNTWQKIPVDTAGFDVIQPSILNYGHGKLQILCRSKQGSVVQAWSADYGKSWSKLSKAALPNPNSGIDAVTLRSGEQLVVYNPDLPGKAWDNGRARLRAATSKNGIDWKDIMILEDGSKEEFSYPAVIQTKNGNVHITYTYDRKNIKYVVLKKRKG